MNNNIDNKRSKIDKLDDKLVNLLIERFELSKDISKLKKNHNIDNYDPERESKIFDNLKNILEKKESLDKLENISAIYKTLLIESKLYQSK